MKFSNNFILSIFISEIDLISDINSFPLQEHSALLLILSYFSKLHPS